MLNQPQPPPTGSSILAVSVSGRASLGSSLQPTLLGTNKWGGLIEYFKLTDDLKGSESSRKNDGPIGNEQKMPSC